ncbi:MAG: DoxX family membrane protein [Prochlorococcaceae cyanobacterium]
MITPELSASRNSSPSAIALVTKLLHLASVARPARAVRPCAASGRAWCGWAGGWRAGFSELIGSWLLILGLLTPLAALALSGTMATAAYQPIR